MQLLLFSLFQCLSVNAPVNFLRFHAATRSVIALTIDAVLWRFSVSESGDLTEVRQVWLVFSVESLIVHYTLCSLSLVALGILVCVLLPVISVLEPQRTDLAATRSMIVLTIDAVLWRFSVSESGDLTEVRQVWRVFSVECVFYKIETPLTVHCILCARPIVVNIVLTIDNVLWRLSASQSGDFSFVCFFTRLRRFSESGSGKLSEVRQGWWLFIW